MDSRYKGDSLRWMWWTKRKQSMTARGRSRAVVNPSTNRKRRYNVWRSTLRSSKQHAYRVSSQYPKTSLSLKNWGNNKQPSTQNYETKAKKMRRSMRTHYYLRRNRRATKIGGRRTNSGKNRQNTRLTRWRKISTDSKKRPQCCSRKSRTQQQSANQWPARLPLQ
jgi:hypothetical protein